MSVKSKQLDLVTPRANLIQVDKAFESMRDAGYDLTAAAGEPIDNSIEAGATLVRIKPFWEDGRRKKIDRIAFADNGKGIDLSILPNVLSMGYSTRYNSRDGMGRFGVGLKLATLSQARRLDVFTRPHGAKKNIFHAFFDLDLISNGEQEYIEAVEVTEFPEEYAHLMELPNGKGQFGTGTLVVWSKIDRLVSGGRYGTALEEKFADLTKFLGRAYRKFINQGVRIELDDKPISLHDPLFLLDNPRVIERYKSAKLDLRGKVLDTSEIKVDGHVVEVTIALCPVEFRWREGEGGAIDKDGKDIKDLHIPDNEGKLSILRNGREIYYDIVPRLLPGGTQWVDRYIGIEVSFPAVLDEYFQVRHVKRGAEPVSKLREELRRCLKKPVAAARKEIRDHWGVVKQQERKDAGDHGKSQEAVNEAEQTAPKGQAGKDLTDQQVEEKVKDLAKDLGIDPKSNSKDFEELKTNINKQTITIVSGDWPGKELFEITHLNGRVILRLNHRHVFMREIYLPVKELANEEPTALSSEKVIEMARKIEGALDVLFMAYAKAENMHDDPDTVYSELRSYWGQFTQSYVQSVIKKV